MTKKKNKKKNRNNANQNQQKAMTNNTVVSVSESSVDDNITNCTSNLPTGDIIMTEETAKAATEVHGASNIVFQICKRDLYISAWQKMYASDKKKWNDKMFDGINPMLNKTPLGTEVDNFCVVAFDKDRQTEEFENGFPVGIFSMVVTKRGANVKPIGKQYIVDPEYQKKGIGSAMMVLLQKELLDHDYDWFYIGCSSMSSAILKKFGNVPYASDDEHDLYKFNVDLNYADVNEKFKKYIYENHFSVLK